MRHMRDSTLHLWRAALQMVPPGGLLGLAVCLHSIAPVREAGLQARTLPSTPAWGDKRRVTRGGLLRARRLNVLGVGRRRRRRRRRRGAPAQAACSVR